MGMCWQCNPHVYSKMTKEGTISSRLDCSSIFSQKVEMNIIMKDASSLWYGCPVHYFCLWCISIHRGYTPNFTEGKWFSTGLFTWREGSQASRLTDAMGKGSFHIIPFITQRFFMLDKCFRKIKIHPMRSSRSHGICRIKVMMAAFLATLYSIVKLRAKREQNTCVIMGLQRTP